MIPCKVFLEKLEVLPDGPKPKISIVLNDIFYDEIKAFQTKYLCLTAHDTITIEAMYDEHDDVVGKVSLTSPYRLAIQNETVQIAIDNKNPQLPLKTIKMSLHLTPVAAFNRKKLGASTKQIQFNLTKNAPLLEQNQQPLGNRLQISFSHRDPLLETNPPGLNIPNLFPNDTHSQDQSLKSIEPDGESLESLAYQRERILGELFGRFKRDK